MKLVLLKTQSYKSIYIEQVDHGKSARISRTSLLLNTGASGPAVKTGRPVMRSLTIFALFGLFFWGIRTILPASIVASSESPARRPSLLRSGPGSTTCPLVETLVVMVRQSYQ